MTARCFTLEELGQIAELPSSDPRRAHLDECPRCAARLAAFADFMAAPGEPDGARVQAADDELERRLDAAILPGGVETRATLAAAARAGGAARRTEGTSWLAFFWRSPQRRWALAAVLPVLLAAGAWLWWSGSRETLMRGTGADSLGGHAFVLAPAQPEANGVRLAWTPVRDADAYQVVLFDTTMAELARLGPAGESTRRITRAELPGAIPPGTLLWWRVIALRDGVELAKSPLGTLEAP